MSSRRGLPDTKRMRHDYHFVEELASKFQDEEGEGGSLQRVPIDRIVTNPHQPRQTMGDLSELVASIEVRGILQPLVVRPNDDHFTLICGERRLRAAEKAGLDRVPVVFLEVEDDELLEIALVENLQRRDLSPFEEAEGLANLAEEFGYTHEEIGQRIGKSRSTVSEILKLNDIPPEIRSMADKAGIDSRSALLQLAKVGDPNEMMDLLDRFTAGEAPTREELARERREKKEGPSPGRPRNFVFRFAPESSNFRLDLRFARSKVSRQEVIKALREALERIMEAEDDGWEAA